MPDLSQKSKQQQAAAAAVAPSTAASSPSAKEKLRQDLRGAGYTAGTSALQPPPPSPFADLTPSQQRYVEAILAIEAANPKATANDIAMAISLLLWEGRIWEKDGKAADVARPAGAPLVLDYAGGKGYQDVKLTREQEQFLQQQRGVKDRHGNASGVTHAFPAVAAQAGREGTAAGSYNTFMTTKGGDFIQDCARMIVEQNFTSVFREAEQRDNKRAIEVAKAIGAGGGSLSLRLAEQFRRENAQKPS